MSVHVVAALGVVAVAALGVTALGAAAVAVVAVIKETEESGFAGDQLDQLVSLAAGHGGSLGRAFDSDGLAHFHETVIGAHHLVVAGEFLLQLLQAQVGGDEQGLAASVPVVDDLVKHCCGPVGFLLRPQVVKHQQAGIFKGADDINLCLSVLPVKGFSNSCQQTHGTDGNHDFTVAAD